MVLINFSLYAKKLASLPEVEKPFQIAIADGQLFISDRSIKLHLYSLKDFSHKLITSKGEGPGETSATPDFTVYPDKVFTCRYRKGMLFDRNGTLQSEYKFSFFGLKEAYPVANYFVVFKSDPSAKKGYTAKEISIYRYTEKNEFDFKKLIYYKGHKNSDLKTGGKWDYPLIKDYFGFIVKDNNVFIADTERGFYVEIYDSEGGEVGKIRLYLEPLKVTDNDKKEIMGKIKKSPHWGIVNKMYQVFIPEYFPAFYRFAVDNQKIYFLTYKKENDRREVIITDYKGKILKNTTVPFLEEYEVHTNFSIEDDKFYYIKENEDTEEWELHVEDIK